MNRSSMALFLSTLALAGGTVACRQAPEAVEQGGSDSKELHSPNQPENPDPPARTIARKNKRIAKRARAVKGVKGVKAED